MVLRRLLRTMAASRRRWTRMPERAVSLLVALVVQIERIFFFFVVVIKLRIRVHA